MSTAVAGTVTQAAPLQVDAVLDVVLASAGRLFSGQGGSVMLLVGPQELQVVCAPGNRAALGARVRFGEGVAGTVASTRDAVLVSGRAAGRSKPVDSAMCVPLLHEGRIFGVLNINATEHHSFSEHDLVAATAFGAHAADALAAAQQYEAERRDGKRPDHHLEAMLSHLAAAGGVDFVEPRRAVLVDAAKVARDVADEAHEDGRPTDVRAPQSVPVLADARHLRRALRELIENGHVHGDAPVRLVFEIEDDAAVLTVADGGPGVPEPDRDHIFEPFVRLERDTDGPGLGLGLTIARRLVDGVGGTLTVGETPVGGGAFQVALRRR